MLVLALIVGFMGPFGTYADGGLVDRITHWWLLLMGAYLLVRPAILGLQRLSRASALPATAVMFWGVVVVSAPLAVIWRNIGRTEFRELDGYAGLLPFSLLCAFAVLGVARWAEKADSRLAVQPDGERQDEPAPSQTATSGIEKQETPECLLLARLSPGFQGPVIALQSEDHYVRVHGQTDSELLLIRLRDAIAEMNGIAGEQVHRSWWVAAEGIERAELSGRSWTIVLTNGTSVPVARDSVSRLQASGLLPGGTAG